MHVELFVKIWLEKNEKCEVKGVQTELVKSKIKLDLMITKYII